MIHHETQPSKLAFFIKISFVLYVLHSKILFWCRLFGFNKQSRMSSAIIMKLILFASTIATTVAFAPSARVLVPTTTATTIPSSHKAKFTTPVFPSPFQHNTSFLKDAQKYDGSCDPYDPESTEYCTADADAIEGDGLKRKLRLTGLFFLWYVLNVGYNIGNKRVLNALPIPWTAATVELFFGFPYVAFLWTTGLRKRPKLSVSDVKKLSSQAFFLAATHVAGVISFSAGAISFTHILKATEPVWSALILAVGFKEFLPLPVYLSLVPILGGVGLASMKELSFTWLSFTAGTISAVTSATKAILSKKILDGKPLGENLTPANMFAVLTILGFLFILPPSLLIEGPVKVKAAWAAALAAGYTKTQLLRLLSVSGFLYYLYNEVAFLALSEVAPVTHAVTNTVKRVVIILASVVVFRTPVSPLGMIGSGVAIAGATAYSIAKNKCK